MRSVVVVRGHQATPWDLRQWSTLPAPYAARFLRTGSNGWAIDAVEIPAVDVKTRRDRLPAGRVGDVITGLWGDHYRGSAADRAFADADIVHAAELSYWFSADAARRRAAGGGFALVQSVWETLAMGDTYRRPLTSRYRREVLASTDLFLPATERARVALLLEGVDEHRVRVCEPGVDVDRFSAAEPPAGALDRHVLVAPGRLVWEKGHHDILRALALLDRGTVPLPAGVATPRLRIIGRGPEEARLHAHAEELGLTEHVEIGAQPYNDMPGAFAGASALVLGSQSSAIAGRHPFDIPRAFWEEQFGLVFVEAMAAGLDIVATTNGAIPEVLDGNGTLVPAGDHIGLARALAAGPLARDPGARVTYPAELLERYSLSASSVRLAAAYDAVLS